MRIHNDLQAMQQALVQAQLAGSAGEVPVGAVVVKNGEIIASAYNAPIALNDPCAHAEILALRTAAKVLGNYRLDGCELFVTLEPCAMCSGAMLQARLQRVVFGATEPKTGAAGSVLNLFALPQLNHHTQVTGGVLAEESATLMAEFFQHKRAQKRMERQETNPHPVRDDALRTPDARFADMPGYPWLPNYVSSLPSLNGLRLHYLDIAPEALANRSPAAITYLCLHGNPAWSYLYRKMIPIFSQNGGRVVAPDLIGFGRSDKPKKDNAHRFEWHRQVLLEFIEHLDLHNVVLVVQDWGGLLGLTLPMVAPERYRGLVVMNTTLATGETPLSPGFIGWREMCAKNTEFDIARLFARGNPQMSPEECAAYMAPFPDAGHRAATRSFPAMVPEFVDSPGAAISREAQAFWSNSWSGQTLMAVGAQDPVLGLPVMHALQQRIRGCTEPMVIAQGGHFVQEMGEPIAQAAVKLFSHSN